MNRNSARAMLVAMIAATVSWPPAAAEDTSAAPAEQLGAWDTLPLPATVQSFSMNVEPGGILWLHAGTGLFYWAGEEFRPAANQADSRSTRFQRLFGGGDRDLYIATAGGELQQKLFRLRDGRIEYVTDFYAEMGYEGPGLYVAKSGKLINWGQRFVEVYTGGQWKRIEARLGARGVTVCEDADGVCVYCDGRSYVIDAQDNITAVKIALPDGLFASGHPIGATAWGGCRVLLCQPPQKTLVAVDLRSGQVVTPESVNSAFAGRTIVQLAPTLDGAVWVASLMERSAEYELSLLTPDGQVEVHPALAGLRWRAGFENLKPQTLLGTADGAYWLALTDGGVACYRDGRLRVFGWRQGLFLRAQGLYAGASGTIYAGDARRVWRYRPDQPPGPPPPEVARWNWYDLARWPVMRDAEGGIWAFLKDQPRKISLWEAGAWRPFEVPFDTSQISYVLPDDRGHILVQMRDHDAGCYDLSRGDAQHFGDMSAMLQAAVRRGARSFFPDRSIAGCVCLADGRIWYSLESQVMYFDGESWSTLPLREGVQQVCASAAHGVLLGTQAGKYYAYDRGQLVEVASRNDRRVARWLWGLYGLQPFEEELLRQYPMRYLPVERDQREFHRYVLLQPDVAEASAAGAALAYVRGDVLPGYSERATPAQHYGGFWTTDSVPHRIFGGRCFQAETNDTPLAGGSAGRVLEDREHNLWFEIRSAVFVQRLDAFALDVPTVPATVGRQVEIAATTKLPGLPPNKLRLWWRIDGGPWQGGTPGRPAVVDFCKPGQHEVELIGMEPLGGTTPAVKLQVTASAPAPKTTVVEPPDVVRDLVWRPKAELTPTEPGGTPHLAYKLDDGPWKVTDEPAVSLAGLDKGPHTVLLAAEEGTCYRDPNPVSVTFRYEPDYDLIITNRLPALTDKDQEKAKRAREEIALAGPQIMAALERQLKEARAAIQRIQVLERLINELRNDPRFRSDGFGPPGFGGG